MIAYLPIAIVVVLALIVVVLWRRTTQQGPVQVYVGPDEQSMSPGVSISGARRRSADEPKATAQRGRRRPTSSPSSTPLHFRLLRRVGIECRIYPPKESAR